MNPVSVDIKDKLVAAEVGTFKARSGWGIYINSEPTSPDTTITIYDTAPGPPEYTFDRSSPPLFRDSIQIRVRGGTYLSAYAKILAISELIKQWEPFWIDSEVKYHHFVFNGMIFLKKDESSRFIWVINFPEIRRQQKQYA